MNFRNTIDKITGKKLITIEYSTFYMCYLIWTDLTEEELLGIEGVTSACKDSEYAEVDISNRYDKTIVLDNIKKLAKEKQIAA